MIQKLYTYLTNDRLMMMCLGGFAIIALIMALIAQYAFGLAPCNLCVIQRYPYGFVIVFALMGFLHAGKSNKGNGVRLFFIGTALLINSAIALYHSGVERLWWKSALEGCNVPQIDPDNILASIQAAPIARCDEIPWADPILGLSMANYNVAFCFGLAVIAFTSMRLLWKKKTVV